MDGWDGGKEGRTEGGVGVPGLLGSWMKGWLVAGRGVEYLELSKLK